jgi:hypothetical protein
MAERPTSIQQEAADIRLRDRKHGLGNMAVRYEGLVKVHFSLSGMEWNGFISYKYSSMKVRRYEPLPCINKYTVRNQNNTNPLSHSIFWPRSIYLFLPGLETSFDVPYVSPAILIKPTFLQLSSDDL